MQKVAQNSIVNALGCGLVLLTLSGCSFFGPPVKQIEISAKPIPKPELTLPRADVVNMKEVKWVIITPNNIDEVVEEAKKKGRPIAFFALTDEGYENLAVNFSSIRALVQQQQAIIVAYENYYKESNEAIDKANEEMQNMADEANSQPDEKSFDLNPFN
jgi:hypothetical protein